MTESSPQLPTPSSPNTPPPQRRKGFGLGGALIRLVFLGLVGAISTGGGVALAVFFPSRNPQAPFLEKALQNLRLVGETRVAPSVLPSIVPNSNNSPEVLPASPIAGTATPSSSPVPDTTSSPTTSPTTSPTPSPTSSPTNPEAAQLQQDVEKVRQQLKEIGDRTTSLEQKLGVTDSQGSLETRLEKLSQQLQTQQLQTPATPRDTLKAAPPSPPSPVSPLTPSPAETITASPNSPASLNPPSSPLPITAGATIQKKITLPTDPLFDSNSNILRPESILLLSQVANELRGIAGTTVQVTVHTSLSGEPNKDRRLSFQQAKAVREYLATQLGDRFRFVAIGYGSTRPLVAASDRLENRRIEIIVE